MTNFATKEDVREIVNEGVADITEIIRDFSDQVDIRFREVDARLTNLEREYRKLDKKFDHLLSTIDSFVGRLDHYETEQAARDSQFDRLLVWARKVSEKTGIPLENL